MSRAGLALMVGGRHVRYAWGQLNQRIPMSIITMLVIGLLVGIVAKFLMPGDDPGGFFITALLGVAGSFIAGYIGRAAGWYTAGEPVSFLASVGGAVVLLILYRLLFRRHRLH
jgi:uncharacterized membrane protein YeaQ/YmgE (transglycosylase-associated protein family)